MLPLPLPADLSFYFGSGANVTPGMESWDTSHVTNMEGAFYRASSFNLDIGGWSTGNVTNMAQMFANSDFNPPAAPGTKVRNAQKVTFARFRQIPDSGPSS